MFRLRLPTHQRDPDRLFTESFKFPANCYIRPGGLPEIDEAIRANSPPGSRQLTLADLYRIESGDDAKRLAGSDRNRSAP